MSRDRTPSIDELIPYTVVPRPDTGINNVKLGMWLFLASEIMLFGALFSGYILLRVGGDDWPRGADYLSVPWAATNTLVLLASSASIVLARGACRRRDLRAFRWWMGLTVLGGGVFLAIKASEYGSKMHHGLLPETNTFLAIYFVLTGLHVLHVVAGVLVNGYFLGPGATMLAAEPARFTNRVEAAGLYWHFVDAVWIVIFVTLYLL